MTKRPRRSLVARTSLATLALALAAPATAQEGTTLILQMSGDIRSTDPGFNRDGNTDYVMSHIVEGLVGFRDDAQRRPHAGRAHRDLGGWHGLYLPPAVGRFVPQR